MSERLSWWRQRVLRWVGVGALVTSTVGALLDVPAAFWASAWLLALVAVAMTAVVWLERLARRADLGRQESAP